MILRKVKGFVENIVGPVRVDSRLIMRKFEGHFQKIPEREELDSGCIFIKFYKIFFLYKMTGKGTTQPFAWPIRRTRIVGEVATFRGRVQPDWLSRIHLVKMILHGKLLHVYKQN